MGILLALDDKDYYIHNDLKKHLKKLGDVTVIDLKEIGLPEGSPEKLIQKAIRNTFDSKQDVLEWVISKFESMKLNQFLPTSLRNPNFDLAFVYTEKSEVLLPALLLGEHLRKFEINFYHDPKIVLNNSYDRWNVINILDRNKLPVPETYLTSLPELKDTGKEFLNKFPQGMVLKPRVSSVGGQVFKVMDESGLNGAIEKLARTEFINYFKQPVIVQPFYQLDKDSNIKLVIIGEKFIGASRRVAGKVEAYTPSKEEVDTCFQAIEVLSLKHAGFDLFSVAGKTLINEVDVDFEYEALIRLIKHNPMVEIIEAAELSADI